MASVKNRTDGPGYVVRWRDAQGRQRKKNFAKKRDADRFKTETEHSLNAGTYVDLANGKQSFRAYAEQWRSIQPHEPNTADNVRSQLTVHVYPVIGSRPVGAILPSEIQALVSGMSSTLAPSSIRTVMNTVRAIFGAAVRDGCRAQNPCQRIKTPKIPIKPVIPLTLQQVDLLTELIDPRYRGLIIFAIGTGMRQGELFGLRVSDVDFLRREVHVRQQIQPKRGGGVRTAAPKTESGTRIIPIASAARDALSAHLAEFPTSSEGYLFTDDQGRPLQRGMFNSGVWYPARRAAAAALRKPIRGSKSQDAVKIRALADQVAQTGMHDLRDFYASVLIRKGMSVKAVAARLGHTNAAMTLARYVGLWPDDEDRTREAIEDLFVDLAKIHRAVPSARPDLAI
jgi:integrase